MIAGHLLGIFLLVGAVTFEALGQLCLKASAAGTQPKDVHINEHKTENKTWWLALGVLCFVTQIFLWTFVLMHLGVGIAFPMTSLSFVIVTLLSRWFLKEHVSGKRWAGVWLILCGVSLVGIG